MPLSVVIYLLRTRLSTLILKGNQFLMLRRATITTLQAKAIARTLIMMATLLLEKNLQETGHYWEGPATLVF